MRVLRRPVAGDVRPVGCAFVLLVFSAVFAATAVPALPGIGAVLYLLVGVAGIVLCAAGLTATAGRLLARRPVLELDDRGVRLPAPWPWPRARDRSLGWTDLAAVVLWSTPVPRGRRALEDHLAFLPTSDGADRLGPPPSAELLALSSGDLPGVPTAHWSIPISPGWDPGVEEILAEIRRRALPATDLRERPRRR
ncbi:hypothetical protein [Actinomadura sp. DC4]|uniref:hypothetical protein n=1 Tax=Actinomadura sp. DC4 TaxID=3055069 RepID=UPI0025B02DD8|nr:hypothetical protein [Actinomadura sp. DC4]MDN3352698.1 hypothetical protein [Actinomadura sp. DC4]